MNTLTLTAILFISQLATAQNLAKQELLDTPRICRIEKSNFPGIQPGSLSYGGLQNEEGSPNLIRLRSYVEQQQFSFINAKGVKITHALNVVHKNQTNENTNTLFFQGVNSVKRWDISNKEIKVDSQVKIVITINGAIVRVNLESLEKTSNAGTTNRYFEASCVLP